MQNVKVHLKDSSPTQAYLETDYGFENRLLFKSGKGRTQHYSSTRQYAQLYVNNKCVFCKVGKYSVDILHMIPSVLHSWNVHLPLPPPPLSTLSLKITFQIGVHGP